MKSVVLIFVMLTGVFASAAESCDESALVHPAIRVLDKAYREGLISAESLQCWLNAQLDSPLLRKALNSEQLVIAKAIQGYVGRNPLPTDREIIQTWQKSLSRDQQASETARVKTARILSPHLIGSVQVKNMHFGRLAFRTSQNGELMMGVLANQSARVYRFKDSVFVTGGIEKKMPKVHRIRDVGPLGSGSLSLKSDDEVEVFGTSADRKNLSVIHAVNGAGRVLPGVEMSRRTVPDAVGHGLAWLPDADNSLLISTNPTMPTQTIGPRAEPWHVHTESDGRLHYLVMTDDDGLQMQTWKDGKRLKVTPISAAPPRILLNYAFTNGPDGRTWIVVITATGLKIVDLQGKSPMAEIPVPHLASMDPVIGWTKAERMLVAVLRRLPDPKAAVTAMVMRAEFVNIYEPFATAEPLVEDLYISGRNWDSPQLKFLDGDFDRPILAAMKNFSDQVLWYSLTGTPQVIATLNASFDHAYLTEDGQHLILVKQEQGRGKISFYNLYNSVTK